MTSSLDTTNSARFNNYSDRDNVEGGLNLEEIKNILVRNLPLIAGCTLGFTFLGYLKVLTTPPIYNASFEILSEPLNIETSVTSTNYNDRSTQTREEITSVELDEVQLKIIKSPALIMRSVESLQDKYPSINYQSIARNLNIEIINQSNKRNILLVKYHHEDKQQVSDVIDNLANLYIDYSLEKRQSGITRGITFLDKQIPLVSSQVEKIENQISNLRSTHNFLDPEISTQQINNRLDSLSQEKEKLAIESQQLQLKLRNFERELIPQPANSTTAIELATPRYLELLNQLETVDIEIARKSVLFLDRSVEIQTLEQEKQEIISLIVKERDVILQKLDNKINSLETRQRSIDQEIANIQLQLEQWSVVFRDYSHLQKKLSIANNKLNEFTLQKDALSIDAAQQEAPWQLLSPATEPKINSISSVNYLFLSSSLGLLVSMGVSLLIDNSKKIIYDTAKIEEITSLPILTNVPYLPKIKDLSLTKIANSTSKTKKLLPSKQTSVEKPAAEVEVEVEVFRSLAANLNLLDLDFDLESIAGKNLKSIAITSAIPGEGKSTVAFNLAKACASLGKKTLLVDTDLRSIDCLTSRLGLESEIGLTNILHIDDNNVGLRYVKQLPWEENLYVVTSGFNKFSFDNQIDSGRLLASVKMHNLMEEFKAQFDTIIYDICSVTGFADVNLLAAKTDGIILVTGLGRIRTVSLVETLKQLRLCQVPILGIVVNNGHFSG